MKKPIVIEAPQYGLAPSAFQGFADIRNLNITDKPGACYPAFRLTNDDNSTTPVVALLIKAWATALEETGVDPYCITDTNDATTSACYKRGGQASYSVISGLSTNVKKNIIYYKGYVAVIYDGFIEWIDPTDDSIITGWASTLTAGGTKSAIHAKDDCLYISSAYGLDKIEEIEGQTFDPANGGTYDITLAINVIEVPERVYGVNEVGDQLVMKTKYKLYFWDMDSVSVTSLVKVNKIIGEMVVYNNLIYFQTGYSGEFLVTNGTTTEPFAKLPETLLNSGTAQITLTNIVIKDELFYFGVCRTGIGTTVLNPTGIYSLNPRNKAIALAHTLRIDPTGSGVGINMGALVNINDVLVLGYSKLSGETYAFYADYLTSIETIDDYAFFITQLLSLGNLDGKENISKVEIQLSKDLVSTDSVKIYYRRTLNGSWVQLGNTWDYSATLARHSMTFPAISDIQNIQFKVVLNNEAELLKMILY